MEAKDPKFINKPIEHKPKKKGGKKKERVPVKKTGN